MTKKKKVRAVKAWAVYNYNNEFCEAYDYEAVAKVSAEEITENWDGQKAYYLPVLITPINPKK